MSTDRNVGFIPPRVPVTLPGINLDPFTAIRPLGTMTLPENIQRLLVCLDIWWGWNFLLFREQTKGLVALRKAWDQTSYRKPGTVQSGLLRCLLLAAWRRTNSIQVLSSFFWSSCLQMPQLLDNREFLIEHKLESFPSFFFFFCFELKYSVSECVWVCCVYVCVF